MVSLSVRALLDEDEDEMSDELEDGDLFEEHVDVSGQQEQEADMSDQEKGARR